MPSVVYKIAQQHGILIYADGRQKWSTRVFRIGTRLGISVKNNLCIGIETFLKLGFHFCDNEMEDYCFIPRIDRHTLFPLSLYNRLR